MGKDLATQGGTPTAMEKVEAFFADIRPDEAEDPIEVQARIMAQILDAPTLDEAFTVGDALSAEDLLDVPLEIQSVRWAKSAYEGGINYFAVAFGNRFDSGLPIVFTTGAGNIVALLRRCELHNEFPVRFRMIRKDRATEAGYFPIVFARIGPGPIAA